jgi:hypothetical protein
MRRFRRLFLGVAAVTSLSACEMPPVGYAHPEAPDVLIITRQEAARHELKPAPLSLPFSGEQDGTKLLVAFLGEARRRGASYVSDAAFYIVRQGTGSGMECQTSVYPEEEIVPQTVPGRFRTVPVSRPVTRMVTEYEYRCHLVSKPVSRMQTTYRTQYDSFSKTTRSVPETHYETHYEMQNECRSEPVTHMVTRYEFELESQFVPPHLEYVSTQKLKQGAPVCYSLEPTDAARHENRVEGIAYTTDESR